ncbi:MAG: DNA topoisomerase IV [Bacteroidetes bacterium GWF2_38_335]|nr:MAG: DNA topoisomerase IV [Bacteroidetes bacterium GWF2_38_335]OFY77835.1 MAG: DNA topoisomerase IV [Bacteroidetes bacterium RIFOXYA12_FULL_38_20]HBS87357.1 DNA gyrase/topoisomerase IV subunit A [Bacteroidales bacterium]
MIDDVRDHIDDFSPENDGFEYAEGGEHSDGEKPKVTLLAGMYKDWFLDYASYVILERAVPHINDGLKPVQRRILHSMRRLEDGRYNKVANVIGHTMQFHPHGDASIGDALVQLGQKDLLIDCQGNWGNVHTGDGAAAARYIEARLSKFALDVVFNPKTTNWTTSYDGRNKEPETLPVKFPLLLAQGVEGIAVGLASKILPHNFIELIEASINYLQGKPFELYPDFPTAGLVDVSKYNDGIRGGSIKVRAKIEKLDKKTLVITQLPFGRTTSTLIESILKSNEKGKIKIKKIDDNTAENVEILIHLAPDVSSDKTIDALYATTDCEISISPNTCVIENDKPRFIGVSEILKHNTDGTLNLLRQELLIRMSELGEDWHMSSLEKIFIEKKIYRKIEECETWEAIIEAIDKGLEPYKKLLKREVTIDDITKLTEIKIKRISKFDSFRADEYIKGLETEMEEVQNHLNNIVEYTINYYKQIQKKHGKGRERKTEIRSFDTIVATKVVVANEKLYVDRKEGFYGTGLKKEEFVCECSDIDDVIVFLKDGKFTVTKVTDKSFFGKDIIHIAVFKKNDERTIYNVIYRDGRNGTLFMKRFPVTGVNRDKVYDLTKGTEGSKIMYFTANPNGEAEVIKIWLKPKPKLRKLSLEFDFSAMAIKGRNSIGNILTKNEAHKITLKEQGVSTLGGRQIWFDWDVLRLNADDRGDYIGEFNADDRILVITKSGKYRLSSFDLSNHYEDDLMLLRKYDPKKIISAVFFDGEQKFHYLKRFQFEPTDKLVSFIGDQPESYLVDFSEDKYPMLEIIFGGKHKTRPNEIIDVEEFIGVKSYKARGKRLTTFELKEVMWNDPKKLDDDAQVVISDDDSTTETTDIEATSNISEISETVAEEKNKILKPEKEIKPSGKKEKKIIPTAESEPVIEDFEILSEEPVKKVKPPKKEKEAEAKSEDKPEKEVKGKDKKSKGKSQEEEEAIEFIPHEPEFIIENKKDKPEKPKKKPKESTGSQMSLFDL